MKLYGSKFMVLGTVVLIGGLTSCAVDEPTASGTVTQSAASGTVTTGLTTSSATSRFMGESSVYPTTTAVQPTYTTSESTTPESQPISSFWAAFSPPLISVDSGYGFASQLPQVDTIVIGSIVAVSQNDEDATRPYPGAILATIRTETNQEYVIPLLQGSVTTAQLESYLPTVPAVFVLKSYDRVPPKATHRCVDQESCALTVEKGQVKRLFAFTELPDIAPQDVPGIDASSNDKLASSLRKLIRG